MNLPNIEPIKWTGTDKIKVEPVKVINEASVTTPEPIKAHESEPMQNKLYNEAKPTPENWNSIIDDLEAFFNSISLPTTPITINPCTTINDMNFFIETNLSIVKSQNGKRTYLPYLNRLQELKQCLN